MYRPPAFAEDRAEVLAALMAAYPLATLIPHGAGGLSANLVPMLADAGLTRLSAHLARANPQLADLATGAEVLLVFQGPQAYVTPQWYASKAEHGRVVPTWNYLMVELRGTPRLIEDRDWLRAHVGALTDRQEAATPDPWKLGDAPEAFIAAQLKGIVGLEIAVTQIAGKWKASQNRPAADRAGVVEGLGDHPFAAHIPAPAG